MGLFRPKTKCGDRWITRRREIEPQLVQKFRSLVIHSAWLDREAMAPERLGKKVVGQGVIWLL